MPNYYTKVNTYIYLFLSVVCTSSFPMYEESERPYPPLPAMPQAQANTLTFKWNDPCLVKLKLIFFDAFHKQFKPMSRVLNQAQWSYFVNGAKAIFNQADCQLDFNKGTFKFITSTTREYKLRDFCNEEISSILSSVSLSQKISEDKLKLDFNLYNISSIFYTSQNRVHSLFPELVDLGIISSKKISKRYVAHNNFMWVQAIKDIFMDSHKPSRDDNLPIFDFYSTDFPNNSLVTSLQKLFDFLYEQFKFIKSVLKEELEIFSFAFLSGFIAENQKYKKKPVKQFKESRVINQFVESMNEWAKKHDVALDFLLMIDDIKKTVSNGIEEDDTSRSSAVSKGVIKTGSAASIQSSPSKAAPKAPPAAPKATPKVGVVTGNDTNRGHGSAREVVVSPSKMTFAQKRSVFTPDKETDDTAHRQPLGPGRGFTDHVPPLPSVSSQSSGAAIPGLPKQPHPPILPPLPSSDMSSSAPAKPDSSSDAARQEVIDSQKSGNGSNNQGAPDLSSHPAQPPVPEAWLSKPASSPELPNFSGDPKSGSAEEAQSTGKTEETPAEEGMTPKNEGNGVFDFAGLEAAEAASKVPMPTGKSTVSPESEPESKGESSGSEELLPDQLPIKDLPGAKVTTKEEFEAAFSLPSLTDRGEQFAIGQASNIGATTDEDTPPAFTQEEGYHDGTAVQSDMTQEGLSEGQEKEDLGNSDATGPLQQSSLPDPSLRVPLPASSEGEFSEGERDVL